MRESGLATEWSLLQNQYDSYEKYSLLIKLFGVGVVTVAHIAEALGCLVGLLLMVLWLQDGIWKTFQSRIEVRLLELEGALEIAQQHKLENASTEEPAYQFNSRYLQQRPSTVGLLREYGSQALRPTVAFPYAVLLVILIMGVWVL